MSTVARAYAATAAGRSLREQEADVFRRVVGALRTGSAGGVVPRAKALADCRLLWVQVGILVRDPENALPESLKASIAAVSGAVQRDVDSETPDFDFLIEVTENMALGLSGK